MKRPLGVFEHTQAYANSHYPFNVVVVLPLSGAPSGDTLKRALELLRGRHPLLAARIQGMNDKPWFDTDGVPAMVFRELPRLSEAHWQSVVEDELAATFDLEAGPLVRAAYLGPEGEERRAEFVWCFQHSIMDAASGVALVRELLDLCADLDAGREPPRSGPLGFPPAADALFTPAQRRGRAGFMLRQLADELRYQWHSRGKRQPRVYPEGRAGVFSLQMDEAASDALVRQCRRRRVTLNSALCAAMLRMGQRRLYGGEERLLRNFVFANLRPYLAPPVPPDNLGSCFAMMRFTTRVPAGGAFWDLARALNEQVYRAARRGEKFHNLLMSWTVMNMMLGQRRFRMSHTALSYTGVADLPRDYGGIRLERLHAFVSNFVLGPEYTAQVRLFAGRLWWDFVYLDCDMERERAQALAREILQELKEVAHIPET